MFRRYYAHFLGVFLCVSLAHANPILDGSSQIYLGGIVKERSAKSDKNKRYIYHDRGFLYLVEQKVGDKTEPRREYYPWGVLKEVFSPERVKYARNGLAEKSQGVKPLLTSQEDALALIRGFEDYNTNKVLPVDIRRPSFKNNMIDGEFAFYSEGNSPTQVIRAVYDEGILSGKVQTFFKSSVERFAGKTKNGMMHGEYRRYQDVEGESVLRESGKYSSGILDGVVTLFYGEGRKYAELHISKGIFNGPVKKYFKTGVVEEDCRFENGERVGECSIFEKNGQVIIKANYAKGRRVGAWSEWYDNGSKKRDAKYVQGKLEGEVLSYFENGKISKRENYSGNLLEGVSTHYNKDGSVKGTATYKENLKDGLTKVYYPSGKLELEISFKNGVKDGIQKKYYETGELQEETKFSYGKQVGFSQSYYKSGVKMGGGGTVDGSSAVNR